MFCKKCGAEISDSASFCIKCGNPVNTVKPTSTEHKNQKEGGFSTKIILAIIAAVIAMLLIIIISLVIRTNGKNDNEASTDATQVSSERENIGGIDFDEIIEQCPQCETAIYSLFEVCRLGAEYGDDEDETLSVSNKLYQAIQHNCTADVIEVENTPYVYRGRYGKYTGQWQGAGPTGTGRFVGKDETHGFIIVYDGEWAYGLPDGEGELYIQRFLGKSRDMTYKGQMSCGLRNGEGYFEEYYMNSGNMVYGNTVFQNDVLAQETEGELFDETTGEVLQYCRVIGCEDGDVKATVVWQADELNPEQKQIVETAEAALVVGMLGYTVYSIFKGSDFDYDSYYAELNAQNMAELAEWNQKKEEAAAEMAEQQSADQKAFQENSRYWAEQDLIDDPNADNWQTQVDIYNAG